MAGFPQVCFIRNTVRSPNILVGEYTYYDDPEDAEDFERNVLYHFPFIGDRLVIGRFCAIARGVRFIMNGANHAMSGISTYPFWIFGNGWEAATPAPGDLPYKGDTVVGNDVWLGYEALVMPGVRIGDGAIVSSRSVVVADVAPYTIVGGNPARPIRQRFDDATIARLLEVAWWNWPVERITAQVRNIVAGDVAALESEGWAGARGERP
jgi:virginiamycin A acetyltransferase